MGSAIEFLGEPTNDLDTDMLAAMEDLLDSWPGTLLVVSHDRYFLERVTDQQYAVMGGKLRHLPGGVDEYLRLRADEQAAGAGAGGGGTSLTGAGAGRGAEASGGRGDGASAGRGAGSGSDSGAGGAAEGAAPGTTQPPAPSGLQGAERRAAEKEMAATERRLGRLAQDKETVLAAVAAHDQSDYVGLAEFSAKIAEIDGEVEQLEERWMELGEQLG